MKISKTHQEFSDYLEQSDALTNPEKYLGPNWRNVLNFWIYLDTLSVQERGKIDDLYWSLDENVLESAEIAARKAANEVVGLKFRIAAWRAAYDVSERWVFGYATDELITSHKLIEQYKFLTFLPLCVKS